MSHFEYICIMILVSVAVPLIVHRLRYGSVEQQSLRYIEKADCSPQNIEFLTGFLEEIRPTTDPELIKKFEAGMEVRRQNAKKYWK